MILDRLRLRTALFLPAAIFASGLLQNGDAQESDAVVEGYFEARTSPIEVKTLDQVRELSENQGTRVEFAPIIRDEVSVFTAFTAPRDTPVVIKGVATLRDPRKAAMARIHEVKEKLSSAEGASEEVQAELKSALAAYFVADMQHRVRELDEIKAKIDETEAKLQRRLDSQQEVVELQLKLTLAEANGLGFFSKAEDGARLTPGPGVSGPGPRASAVIGKPGPAHLPLGASKGR